MSVFKLTGVNSELEVFEDKLTITPKGVSGFLSHGVKGVKTIPFRSITAIQFKEAGLMSGYLQFTLSGGQESKKGIMSAASDENTFMYAQKRDNAAIEEVKNYIESRTGSVRPPAQSAPSAIGVADELVKLAGLRDQGVLSEAEFQDAKAKLMGGGTAQTVRGPASPQPSFATGKPPEGVPVQPVLTTGKTPGEGPAQSASTPAEVWGTRKVVLGLALGFVGVAIVASKDRWMVIAIVGFLVTLVSMVGFLVQVVRRRPKGPWVVALTGGFVSMLVGAGATGAKHNDAEQVQALAGVKTTYVAASTAAAAPPPEVRWVAESCVEMATNFGMRSKLTDLQKKAIWDEKNFEGSHFKWVQMEVTSVDTTFGKIHAQFKCGGSEAFVSDIILGMDDQATALKLVKGNSYTVHGTLKDYGNFTGLSGDLVEILE